MQKTDKDGDRYETGHTDMKWTVNKESSASFSYLSLTGPRNESKNENQNENEVEFRNKCNETFQSKSIRIYFDNKHIEPRKGSYNNAHRNGKAGKYSGGRVYHTIWMLIQNDKELKLTPYFLNWKLTY